MTQVTVYVDGACSGNPGPGGWGVILEAGTASKELSGGKSATTNNEMELAAVLAGLQALKDSGHDVTIVTDSANVIGWLSLGWKRKAVHLRPTLHEIDTLLAKHSVTFEKVAGHSGHPQNERCDALARAALERYR